jgi:hypothetical protein
MFPPELPVRKWTSRKYTHRQNQYKTQKKP